MPARKLRLCVSLIAATGLLTGCAQGQFSTQMSRIGPDDGTDSCRPQLVALDSTGNFFGAQILTGAAVGGVAGGVLGGVLGRNWQSAAIGAATGAVAGAATGYWMALQQQSQDQAVLYKRVQGDLWRENAQIDRTQLAFDHLTDCRFRQAQAIRADYAARRIDRPTALAAMAVVKQRAQRDIALARQINGQIADRGQQFDVAADKLAPGTQAAIAAQAPSPKQTTVRRAAPLKLSPEPNAPDVGQLQPSQPVTVTPDRSGYALVTTASGERGYTPQADLQPIGRPGPTTSPVSAGNSDEVRTLAGSNAARRDSFEQSVSVSERASSGFELAG
jgi:outer membrane lipoprotein SlyB